MRIMVDLDRTVFDCPSITYFFGNMVHGETNLHKELKYEIVDSQKALDYTNKLFFLKMSHASNFTAVDRVVEVLDKWYRQGIEVTFVSNRVNYRTFQRATAEWLYDNGIKYDNIIFACTNKAMYGKTHSFDMIIDDSIKNCKDCLKVGITPIWLRNKYNAKTTNYPHCMLQAHNWSDIDTIVQARLLQETMPAQQVEYIL